MTYVEHYFENLVLLGEDVSGEFNKNALSPEVRSAVEECAQHLCYSLFTSREEFVKIYNSLDEPETNASFIRHMTDEELAEFIIQIRKGALDEVSKLLTVVKPDELVAYLKEKVKDI